jgi:hypothetical protein
MASFAHLNEHNEVTQVIVISDDIAPDDTTESELAGQLFISNTLMLSGVWIKTSYGLVSVVGSDLMNPPVPKPFRGTHAEIGYIYDAVTDTFTSPESGTPDGNA